MYFIQLQAEETVLRDVAVCTDYADKPVSYIFMDIILNALQYHLLLLNEHTMSPLTSLTRNLLFESQSPINIFIILKELKHWEPNFL